MKASFPALELAAQKLVNVFLERGSFPVEATLLKASSSGEQKNSRRKDCNGQGGQHHRLLHFLLLTLHHSHDRFNLHQMEIICSSCILQLACDCVQCVQPHLVCMSYFLVNAFKALLHHLGLP